jgi:hypothetical protein
MEADQSQTAPGASLPTVGTDASSPALGDPYTEALAAFEQQGGASEPETDASVVEGEPSEPAAPDTAPDDRGREPAEPIDADEADLAQYPESVREAFRALEPEQRKALYEHAEARVSDRIETERKRNDELAATQQQAEARRQDIRSKVGRFVGVEAQTITLSDGTTRALPSYADLDKMLRSQSGRDQLYDRYGLSQDSAEAVRAEWDDRNQMLDAAAESLEIARLSAFDGRFRQGIRSEGLDPDAMLNGADGPETVAVNLIRHLKAQHAEETSQLKKEHEARAAAQNLNAEGLRGRVLAATSRRLPTGGRSGAGSGPVTVQRLIEEAGSPEEYARRAAAGEYAHVQLNG